MQILILAFLILLRNTAFLYGNEFAFIAYKRERPENFKKTKLIADSFVYAQTHEPYFKESLIRRFSYEHF